MKAIFKKKKLLVFPFYCVGSQILTKVVVFGNKPICSVNQPSHLGSTKISSFPPIMLILSKSHFRNSALKIGDVGGSHFMGLYNYTYHMI